MKTVFRTRPSNVPDADPEIQKWCEQENRSNRNLTQDLEFEFGRVGQVKVWTPVLTCVTPGNLSVSYSTQLGELVRTKELVIASFQIMTSAFTWTTASGNVEITGLPLYASTATADSSCVWNGSLGFQGITKASYTQYATQIRAANNYLFVTCSGSGQAAALLQMADMPSGGTVSLTGTVAFRVKP